MSVKIKKNTVQASYKKAPNQGCFFVKLQGERYVI